MPAFEKPFFFPHDTIMYSLFITLAIMLCPPHGVDNSNKCLDGRTDENTHEKYLFTFLKNMDFPLACHIVPVGGAL